MLRFLLIGTTLAAGAFGGSVAQASLPAEPIILATVDIGAAHKKLTPPVARFEKILKQRVAAAEPVMGEYLLRDVKASQWVSGNVLHAPYCVRQRNTTGASCVGASNWVFKISIYDTAKSSVVIDSLKEIGAKVKVRSGVSTFSCAYWFGDPTARHCGAVRVGNVTVAIQPEGNFSRTGQYTEKQLVALLKAYRARG